MCVETKSNPIDSELILELHQMLISCYLQRWNQRRALTDFAGLPEAPKRAATRLPHLRRSLISTAISVSCGETHWWMSSFCFWQWSKNMEIPTYFHTKQCPKFLPNFFWMRHVGCADWICWCFCLQLKVEPKQLRERGDTECKKADVPTTPKGRETFGNMEMSLPKHCCQFFVPPCIKFDSAQLFFRSFVATGAYHLHDFFDPRPLMISYDESSTNPYHPYPSIAP